MIYLDHHSTTPVDPRVLDAMLPFFTERFGNPSSRTHRLGWDASEAVEDARRQVAALIGAQPKEVVFTSGATEANALALKGIAAASGGRRHLVTVATEHRSVLDTAARLEREGWLVTRLPVQSTGLVSLEALDRAITANTALVSVMLANNEIGVLQPLADIAARAHAKGALVHTDAVQAAGKVPMQLATLGVDMASITAHKIYGPKGCGALFVRKDVQPRVAPLLDGGGQERGLRSGTLNVPGIVGFGAAAVLAQAALSDESTRLETLRDRLFDGLSARIVGVTVNGLGAPRLPGNLNVSFEDVDGEALLISLDQVAVSSGAACTKAEPSHVLMALGVSRDRALASLRFGLGRGTTAGDVDGAAEHVADAVKRLRAMAPA
jgi:cysteine desulfurase